MDSEPSGPSGQIAAIVLAGGRATRLGGADKPGITIGGRSLLYAAASAALGAGASRIVVVGPPRPGLLTELRAGYPPPDFEVNVEFTTEQPPGAGPVPAMRAGLELVAEPWLLLLAADLPFLRAHHLTELLAAAWQAPAGPGAIFVDDYGQPQWLTSCWKTASLRTALARYQGGSLGGVLGPLRPAETTITARTGGSLPWIDCDTSHDVTAALALAAQAEATEERGSG